MFIFIFIIMYKKSENLNWNFICFHCVASNTLPQIRLDRETNTISCVFLICERLEGLRHIKFV